MIDQLSRGGPDLRYFIWGHLLVCMGERYSFHKDGSLYHQHGSGDARWEAGLRVKPLWRRTENREMERQMRARQNSWIQPHLKLRIHVDFFFFFFKHLDFLFT